jgi:hypothetical protein
VCYAKASQSSRLKVARARLIASRPPLAQRARAMSAAR